MAEAQILVSKENSTTTWSYVATNCISKRFPWVAGPTFRVTGDE